MYGVCFAWTGVGAAISAAGFAATVAALGANVGGIIAGGVLVGVGIGGVVYAVSDTVDGITGEFELPTIAYTPESIFSNTIPAFNINFFNPMKHQSEKIRGNYIQNKLPDLNNFYSYSTWDIDTFINSWAKDEGYNIEKYTKMEYYKLLGTSEPVEMDDPDSYNKATKKYERKCFVYQSVAELKYELFDDKQCYEIKIEQISFFKNGRLWKCNYAVRNIDIYSIELKPVSVSSSVILQSTVSSIYKSLRTVAIVAMLTILIYVGIRIVLSSASKDKAKYKQMLMDWLVAFIMLFILHYVMAFIIDICETMTNICQQEDKSTIVKQIPNGTRMQNQNTGDWDRLDGGDEGSDWWITNFVGSTRFEAGLVLKRGLTMSAIAYTLMYLVLVIYTLIFTFQYIKRVIYMAFLTMIAPLVAITYPLDKINDGKAQGFNLWLREYIFNALLQPMHYIIYVIIVGSTMDLVVNYPIYGLVALGFMTPAEKFIRKMFGFEKAGTVGAFGGAAGAAMLMGGIQKLTHKAHGKKGNSDNGARGTDSKNFGRVKSINGMPESSGDSSGSNSQPSNRENSQVTNDEDPDQLSMDFGTPELNSLGGNSTSNDASQNTEVGESIAGTTDKKKSALRNGLKAVGGHYGRRIANTKVKPLRSLRRGLTYGAGAATLGAIGLAAGIASGDPSKALQYTTTGAMVGGSLGRNLGDTASNFIGLEGAGNAFNAGYMGEEYAANERAKYNRDFKMNVSNYDAAVSKVTPDGWAEMSQEGGIIDASLEYGINDIGTMCNIYKTSEELRKNGYGDRSQEYAFKAYKLSKDFGDISKNKKTDENLKYILQQKGNMGAYNEIRDLIKTYNNIAMD